MKKHTLTLIPLMALLAVLPLIINTLAQTPLAPATSEIINLNGDVSLTETQNRNHWNPHTTGYTNTTTVTLAYKNQTQITLDTTNTESGHIATGAWWTTSFKNPQKLPLYTTKPIKLTATFRINIAEINYTPGNEWLRIALACAVQHQNGMVIYTELDIWDTPNTLNHPTGNTRTGGNTIYRAGDVTEYKIAQTPTGQWTSYDVDLTQHINQAWTIHPGDKLESVYAVIETLNTTAHVTLSIDDLWITQTT